MSELCVKLPYSISLALCEPASNWDRLAAMTQSLLATSVLFSCQRLRAEAGYHSSAFSHQQLATAAATGAIAAAAGNPLLSAGLYTAGWSGPSGTET